MVDEAGRPRFFVKAAIGLGIDGVIDIAIGGAVSTGIDIAVGFSRLSMW